MTTGLVRTIITAPTRAITDSVTPAYRALSDGILDIPEGTLTDIPFEIPFGGVDSGATVLHVKNKSGQDMVVTLATFNLADGGEITITNAVPPADDPVLAMSLTTTDTVVGTTRTIEYLVAGDPA